MTERGLVTAAITIMGLWRIFYDGVTDLYFVVVKQLGLKTSSTIPVAVDIQELVWAVLFGVIIIIAAPAIADMIYGKKTKPQPQVKL